MSPKQHTLRCLRKDLDNTDHTTRVERIEAVLKELVSLLIEEEYEDEED